MDANKSSGSKKSRCFVIGCHNNPTDNKDKKFAPVPRTPSDRVTWFKAANRTFSTSTHWLCCEDHFDIQRDLKSAINVNKRQLKVKHGVIPHKNMPAVRKPSSQLETPPKRQRVSYETSTSSRNFSIQHVSVAIQCTPETRTISTSPIIFLVPREVKPFSSPSSSSSSLVLTQAASEYPAEFVPSVQSSTSSADT